MATVRENLIAAKALIDTPEEYDRVANACDGEISKRLKPGKAATP